MEISFCPYRTQISPSKVLYTAVSQPVTFTGGPKDLELLDACVVKEGEEGEDQTGEWGFFYNCCLLRLSY